MPFTTFLNGGAAIQLRGLQWMTLSEDGRIGAGSIVGDSGGGGTTSWTYGGTIPCRLDPLTGDEGVMGARLSDQSTHLITVPAETAVSGASRFQITGRGTFEITAVRERTGEWARFIEAVEVT